MAPVAVILRPFVPLALVALVAVLPLSVLSVLSALSAPAAAASSSAPADDEPSPSGELLSSGQRSLSETPLAALLDGLDPRCRDIVLEIETMRFGTGVPGWPDHQPFLRIRATARFAGDAFFIEQRVQDLTTKRPAQAETIAFDGTRAFVRGDHSRGWLLTSRSFRLPPDLQHLGFVAQTGLGLGWLASEGRTLQDDLGIAQEVGRRDEEGRLSVAYSLPRTAGEPAGEGVFELVVDRTGGFTRMLAVGDVAMAGAGGTPVRRSGIRAQEWLRTEEGITLPAVSEYVMERAGQAAAAAGNRAIIRVLRAAPVAAEETLDLIRDFAVPRPGETVFDSDLRLQFRTGERRFLLEGANYEANAPLRSVPGETVHEILAQARRLDGGWREAGASPSAPGMAVPLNPVSDGVRWIQVCIGLSFIAIGLVLWRRA